MPLAPNLTAVELSAEPLLPLPCRYPLDLFAIVANPLASDTGLIPHPMPIRNHPHGPPRAQPCNRRPKAPSYKDEARFGPAAAFALGHGWLWG